MNLSKNFTLEELIRTSTDIKNVPSDDVIYRLAFGCVNVLQPLRDVVNEPIYINSGFRCPKLNAAVGGVANSQHLTGNAADIRVTSKSIGDLYFSKLRTIKWVDQALYERSGNTRWLHVSWSLYPRRYYNANYVV